VHVISQKALRDFWTNHHDSELPLRAWHKAIRASTYRSLDELKQTFASVDYVPVPKGKFYVFNIGGNKYRLVAAIHFNRQRLFVRHVLTHKEYDQGAWKQ
jgi:mRNA interferase HigB